MKYHELRRYFELFNAGLLSKLELCFAIGLWQRGGSQL